MALGQAAVDRLAHRFATGVACSSLAGESVRVLGDEFAETKRLVQLAHRTNTRHDNASVGRPLTKGHRIPLKTGNARGKVPSLQRVVLRALTGTTDFPGLPPGSALFQPSGLIRPVFARHGCQVGLSCSALSFPTYRRAQRGTPTRERSSTRSGPGCRYCLAVT